MRRPGPGCGTGAGRRDAGSGRSAHLKLRNDEAKARVLEITGELADLADLTSAEAHKVLLNARRGIARRGGAASGRLTAAVVELEVILGCTAQVVAQTRSRLGGVMPASATRLVSLHDPDARPIGQGSAGQAGGVRLPGSGGRQRRRDRGRPQRAPGNPPDAPLLVPAIARIHALLGRVVRAVTADRGYGEAKIEQELTDLGVAKVVIPRKGKPSAARRAVEHGRGFRRLVTWRTGSEGRISCLKRRYGWDRTLFDTLDGAQTWCGLGVLAHSTVKIAALIQADQPRSGAHTRPGRPRPAPRSAGPDPAATGPPPEPLFHHDAA